MEQGELKTLTIDELKTSMKNSIVIFYRRIIDTSYANPAYAAQMWVIRSVSSFLYKLEEQYRRYNEQDIQALTMYNELFMEIIICLNCLRRRDLPFLRGACERTVLVCQ